MITTATVIAMAVSTMVKLPPMLNAAPGLSV